jgi:hypothetical protein
MTWPHFPRAHAMYVAVPPEDRFCGANSAREGGGLRGPRSGYAAPSPRAAAGLDTSHRCRPPLIRTFPTEQRCCRATALRLRSTSSSRLPRSIAIAGSRTTCRKGHRSRSPTECGRPETLPAGCCCGRGPGVRGRAIGAHHAPAFVKSNGDRRTAPIHATRPRRRRSAARTTRCCLCWSATGLVRRLTSPCRFQGEGCATR